MKSLKDTNLRHDISDPDRGPIDFEKKLNKKLKKREKKGRPAMKVSGAGAKKLLKIKIEKSKKLKKIVNKYFF